MAIPLPIPTAVPPALLGGHSTAPPEVAIPLIALGLLVMFLRFRSRGAAAAVRSAAAAARSGEGAVAPSAADRGPRSPTTRVTSEALRRETPPVPDQNVAVSRGMAALLARRDAELAGGASPVGWKIGFNTPAIQQHFGLHDPVVGYLVDTGVTADGATVSLSGWTAPAVEVEVAVRVGDRGEVAGLAPALELVDLDLPFDDLEAVLAGNICQRGVVFGAEVPGVDPWTMAATVTKAGEVVADGRLVEDPAATVAFVRSFLADHGAVLEPGHRIIAGSVTAPSRRARRALRVSFGPLGQLDVNFSN